MFEGSWLGRGRACGLLVHGWLLCMAGGFFVTRGMVLSVVAWCLCEQAVILVVLGGVVVVAACGMHGAAPAPAGSCHSTAVVAACSGLLIFGVCSSPTLPADT